MGDNEEAWRKAGEWQRRVQAAAKADEMFTGTPRQKAAYEQGLKGGAPRQENTPAPPIHPVITPPPKDARSADIDAWFKSLPDDIRARSQIALWDAAKAHFAPSRVPRKIIESLTAGRKTGRKKTPREAPRAD